MTKDIGNTIVSMRDMTYLLGLERRQIDILSKQGVLPKTAAGKFKLVGVRNYIEKQRQRDDRGAADAKTKWIETKTQIEEMKRQLMMGEVVRFDEALSVFGAVISIIRTRMLALPSRCAPRIIGQASSIVETAEIVREEVYAILDYVVQAKQAAIDSIKPPQRL